MSWLDALESELRAAGIPSARRRRIASELADHLAEDPSAAERLGEPSAIARQFADELGTTLARRAGFAVFVALAPVGLLFGLLYALMGMAGFRPHDLSPVGPAIVIGVQLAFVGGALAVLRAWRLRGRRSISRADTRVLLLRTALGLGGGALTLGAIAVAIPGFPARIASWYGYLAWATVGVGTLTLAVAAVAALHASRLRPDDPGDVAGDLAFDLPFGVDARTLARWITLAVVVCIAIAGIFQDDPFDGLARALADGGLCYVMYLAFGRPLGLRA